MRELSPAVRDEALVRRVLKAVDRLASQYVSTAELREAAGAGR
jgi:hypothetical protein